MAPRESCLGGREHPGVRRGQKRPQRLRSPWSCGATGQAGGDTGHASPLLPTERGEQQGSSPPRCWGGAGDGREHPGGAAPGGRGDFPNVPQGASARNSGRCRRLPPRNARELLSALPRGTEPARCPIYRRCRSPPGATWLSTAPARPHPARCAHSPGTAGFVPRTMVTKPPVSRVLGPKRLPQGSAARRPPALTGGQAGGSAVPAELVAISRHAISGSPACGAAATQPAGSEEITPRAGQGAAGAARPIPPAGSGAASSGSRGHTNNSWQQAGKEASSAGGQAGTAGPPPATAQCFRCPSPGCRSPGAPRGPSSWEGRGGVRQPLAGVRSVKRRQNPQQHSPSSVPVCCPQGFKSTPWGSDRGDGAPQDPPLLGQGGHQYHCPVGKQRAPQPSFPAGYQARCLALLLPALCLSFPRPDPS